MQKNNTMQLTLPARSENEGFARVAVGAFAARLDPTLEELADLKTAVSEAVTNAIVHGYADAPGGQIHICAAVEGDWIEVQVRDEGCGIADVPQAMQPFYTTQGEMERSGMGFTVMQTFTDCLQVRSAPGQGTCVTMRKQMGRGHA